MQRGTDIKGLISLLLSVLASLVSLAGIAYAAGSLTTRVDNVEHRVSKLDTTPERLATIEAKLDFLVREAAERKEGEKK